MAPRVAPQPPPEGTPQGGSREGGGGSGPPPSEGGGAGPPPQGPPWHQGGCDCTACELRALRRELGALREDFTRRAGSEIVELITHGFDDFQQLVGDAFGNPIGVGIRVPSLAVETQGVNTTYRILAAVADLDRGDAIIGWRQGLTLVADTLHTILEDNTVVVREQRWIDTPDFQLPDSFATWTITLDTKAPRLPLTGPVDQESFAFRDSATPALVYETATFPGVPTAPGYLGLDSYTPPSMIGRVWYVARSINHPWQRQDWGDVHYQAERPTRVRVYVDVTQSDPSRRFIPTYTFGGFDTMGLCHETQFVQLFQTSAIIGKAAVALRIKRR